jgi:hypothetical protein
MSRAGTLDRKIARALSKPHSDSPQHRELLANRVPCPHPLCSTGECNDLPDTLEMLIREHAYPRPTTIPLPLRAMVAPKVHH